MKAWSCLLAMLVCAGAMVFAAEQTWTGQISDSICKAKHEPGAEGETPSSEAECTRSCVRGGSKYVLLVGDKVYQIANQKQADLEKNAGQKVKLTGEISGDSITVSKVEPAK